MFCASVCFVILLTRRLPGGPRGLRIRTKLTPSFVAQAVPKAGKDRTIYWDQAQPGFGLMVTEAGSKSWVVQYRANGQSRRATIDSVLTLDKARKRAKAMLGKVAIGGDPVAEERAAAAAEANTLQSVAEEYLKREAKNLRSQAKRRATLERLVFPKLGTRQIGDIKRSEISRLLDTPSHPARQGLWVVRWATYNRLLDKLRAADGVADERLRRVLINAQIVGFWAKQNLPLDQSTTG